VRIKFFALVVLALALVTAACTNAAGQTGTSPSAPAATTAPAQEDGMMKDDSMKETDAMAEGDAMQADDGLAEDGAMQNADSMAKPDAMMGDDTTEQEDGMAKPDAMSDGDARESDEAMAKSDAISGEDAMAKPEAMSRPEERYVAYSPDALAAASQNGRAVLFFKADWCPTCRAADAEFQANLEGIPADVTVLVVNYDAEGALKQKYNITYQHTFVQVDGDGEQVCRWNGGAVGELLANLQ
jgi:thiol-disulfide isomerase/thioredoxin